MKMQDDMSNSTLKSSKGSATSEESPRLVLSSQNNQAGEKEIALRHGSFMTENSESDDEDASEIDSFVLDQDYDDGPGGDEFLLSHDVNTSGIDYPYSDVKPMANVDPQTQAKLAALLEAAGLGSFTSDGRHSDPEVIKKLTSSVSNALDEAAAALNRMRLENPDSESKTLAEACCEGQIETVKALLDKGVNIQQTSEEGNTPLMCACAGGYEDIVILLLDNGANIEDHNENGHTPLMEAASAGHVPIAKILLDHGAGINTHSSEFKESALTLACYKGHVDMVRYLLGAGADQEHKTDEMHTALMEASMDGHVEVAKLLLDSGAQVNMPADSFESPLTLAACGGHVELAMLLLERGANIEEVNDEGYTPLMEAAREGHEEMVALLLSQDADINAQTEETQETALTLACCGGFLEVAEFLVKAGANIEAGASTPLMESAQEGHVDLVKYLIEAGCNVNAATATCDTALTYACENGHTDCAITLVEHEALLEHESEGGRTPLMKAARSGHLCTVQFLLSRGANVNKQTTNNDHTPLSLACSGGHNTVVEFLLRSNADPNHKLKDNSTMLIEASRGGHSSIVKLLLDYPNSLHQAPPPPPPPSSTETINSEANTMDSTLEIPRVPPHGHEIVETDAGHTLPSITTSQSYLHNIQSGVDPAHYQSPVQLTGMQSSNVRPNIPSQRPSIRNINPPGKASIAHPTNSKLLPETPQFPPHLYQLIKSCHTKSFSSDISESDKISMEELTAFQSTLGFDLAIGDVDDKELFQATEKIETSMNLIKANEKLSSPEELLFQKQQDLEELQRTERDCQAKAQAQFLSDAHCYFDQIAPSIAGTVQTNNSQNTLLFETVNSPVFNRHFEDITQLDLQKNLVASPMSSLSKPESLHNTTFELSDENDLRNIGACTTSEMPSNMSVDSILEGTQNICLTSGDCSSALCDPAITSNFSTYAKFMPDDNQIASQTLSTSTTHNTTISASGESRPKPKGTKQRRILPSIANLSPESRSAGLGESSTTISYPVSLQAALVTAPNAVGGGNTVGTPTLTMTTSMLSADIGGASQFIATESNIDAGVGGLMVASPARTLHDTLSDDTSVPTNQIAGSAQYNASVFTSNQQSAQMQTAMAQAYIPQSSCTVATQCMVDPCLMGQATESLPGSSPLPYYPSNQMTSSVHQYPFDIDSQTESNHDTALTLACAGGHEELVKLLLIRGANIEHRDKKGFTPLILAATAGHIPIVKMLVDNGADIEAQSERTKDTPLSLACSGGRYEIVEILLNRTANKEHRNVSDYTPLSLAASGGYVNIIKLLLSNGAEINSRTGSKLGISPLMLAAMNGHTPAVKLLLDMGSDINAQIETNRNTALTLACFQGRHEVVSLLVERKASIEHRAKTGLTPLMEAASGGYTDVGRVLLEKCADVNASPVPSSKDTALTIAADKGHYRFVELLLSRGAAVDVKNKKGNSPLWLACNGGHLDVAQLLINAGAHVDSQDNRKISCLMAAFRKGHVKVVRWMVEKVIQFPADSDCVRYIANIGEEDLKSKCKECNDIIQSAKVKQAEEANKNASDLLDIIDEEKNREANKKAAAARKREKKKLKRKEKQQASKDQVVKSPEELKNIKNENTNNLTLDQCDTIENVNSIPPITPHLPPGLTLTPITGDYPPPRREEKNTVSITKIGAALVTTSTTTSSEPTVTNMGPVIVVETKSSTISLIDHVKSSKNSQPMVTISKHGNGPSTVSSSKFDSNLLCTSASSATTPVKQISNKSKSIKNESNASSKLAEKSNSKSKTKENKRQANKENKPTKEKVSVSGTSTTVITTITTVTTTSSVTTTSGEKSVTLGKKSKRKEASEKSHSVAKKELQDSVGATEKLSTFNDNNYIINQLSTTGIGDLDDFGSLPDSNIKSKTYKGKNIDLMNSFQRDFPHVDTIPESVSMHNPNSTLINSLRPTIPAGHPPNLSSSPKKGQKKEDGWKEVVRKAKRVLIPPHAVSRLIRHPSISAIKGMSNASIEFEKKDSGGDRYAVIRGSNDAVRQASNIITALLKNQEMEPSEAKAVTLTAPVPGKPIVGSVAVTPKPTKNKSSGCMSIYSTPPFPATSVIKQPARPGIPTTSLSNIGAPFSSVSQSWSTFISTSQPSAVSPSSRKVLGNDNSSKTQATRQLFNEVSKPVPNVAVTSVNKEVVSYTTAVMAPGRNTRTVTTMSTSMCVHDYKINPTLRPTNQAGASPYEKNSQFKQIVSQNGQLRMANVQHASSNSSSGSSGSPVAQDYDPFNSNFMGPHSAFNNQQNGNKSKNFASVAASGVTSLASTNPTIGSLQQTSVQSPTPTSAIELQCGPVDVAKAPGYRGTGSHMSPGSNSASSGHYSAPNTPPIALIGSSHSTAGQRSHSSPSASSSPPIRPSSLPEHPAISEKSLSTSTTILAPDNCVNNIPRVSSYQINANEKHPSNIIGNSSSYISNSVPSVCQPGILSVGNSVPGSSFAHPSINMINSVGGQTRLPVMPISNQGYPHRMVNPPHLQSFNLAQNAMNMTMPPVSTGPFPSNNIVSNLNPNAPDFASRSNSSGIMPPNIQPRLQLQHELNHQSAFRPLMQNHSFHQTVSSSGFPSTTRMSFVPQLPLDVMGVPTDPSFILNRQSNINNINTNNVTYPSQDPLVDGNQHHLVANSTNKNSASTNQAENQAIVDDRRSLPRPIGTERAYKKPTAYGSISDDKGIWSYSADPSAPDWMSKRSYGMNNSQNIMTMNQDDSRIPPVPHVMANGTLPNYHPVNAKMVAAVGTDILSVPVEQSHHLDPLYQNIGPGNQSSLSSHYNSMPSGMHSNYLNNIQPNVMAVIGNQNNANSVNGPNSDYWVHPKLANSATKIDSHPSSASLPDQKQVWK